MDMRCHNLIGLFYGTLLFIPVFATLDIDNQLIGFPEIDCRRDTIEMKFRTKRRFTGHYSNPECRVDYGTQNSLGEPVGGIRLHHGFCDMDRQRTVNPEGMQFSTILVVSFHPVFVTKTDRAFRINCQYKETAKEVAAGMTVSPITPEPVARDMPLPSCTYTIHKDKIDGPILRYAQVGEPVVHKWDCQSDMYGMLVHSCNVEDGQGEKKMVIDEKGCHVYRDILGDPTYTESLDMAYRESAVFKFADKIGVRFSCEIKLCIKESGGCAGITPPNCSNDFQNDLDMDLINEANYHNAADWNELMRSNGSTSIANASTAHEHAAIQRHSIVGGSYQPRKRRTVHGVHLNTSALNTVSTDLISQYVYVLDTVEDPAEKLEGIPSYLMQSTNHRPSICLNSTTFVTILAVAALAFGFASIIMLRILLRYRK